ncbi:MAG TPA: hypothetical protein VNN19_10390 [bacterium]|nr:hypothetical protein [bacterium]
MRLSTFELDNLAGDVLSWRELMAGGPQWLTAALAATEAARERLRAWFVAEPRRASEPSRSEIAGRLQFLGDEAIRQVVLDVLFGLPPVVVAFVLSSVVMLGVGRGSAGSTLTLSTKATTAAAEGYALKLILLDGHRSDQDLRVLIAHEVAHAWLGALPRSEDMRQPAEGLAALRELGRAAGEWAGAGPWPGLRVVRDLQEEQIRSERQAAALAASWGWADDAERCAAGAVIYMSQQMEAAL